MGWLAYGEFLPRYLLLRSLVRVQRYRMKLGPNSGDRCCEPCDDGLPVDRRFRWRRPGSHQRVAPIRHTRRLRALDLRELEEALGCAIAGADSCGPNLVQDTFEVSDDARGESFVALGAEPDQ